MSLEKKFQAIHRQALEAAQAYRRAEAGLIDALIAVERERVFARLGFSSLFVYAVEALGLSEASSYNAIAVARKAREVPQLMAAIREGSVSISKAKKIASVLTPENQEEWLAKAKALSSRKIEKEVARENPRAAAPERASYVSERRLALSLGVSEELMLKLRRAQDRVSQARGRASTLEETLEEMVTFFLKHKDPVEKARRVIAKKGAVTKPGEEFPEMQKKMLPEMPPEMLKDKTNCSREQSPEPGRSGGSGRRERKPLPAALLHQIQLRDQGACQHRRPDGALCGERRWVDLHHVVPVSRGGEDSRENLVTLCRVHHALAHGRG